MVTITVGENEKDQRLDRFLRKYFNRAPLSLIYKMIRKDVKVNGKRAREDTMLAAGDEIRVYLSDQEAAKYRKVFKQGRAKKQFGIVYEDEELLIADKPAGLLTHGDEHEKKNTLVNQVVDYLIEKGDYVPRAQTTFVPACVNRLDRNTSGLVIFGKTAKALRLYNRLIADKDAIEKYYLTIVAGELKEPVVLTDVMVKDEDANRASIVEAGADGANRGVSSKAAGKGASDGEDAEGIPAGGGEDSVPAGKRMESRVVPLARKGGYTLAEVRILTGRSHQIRLQLAHLGYPIIGDPKYGKPAVNDKVRRQFGLNTQLLHCARLVFHEGALAGQTISCDPPALFEKIKGQLF